MKETIDKTNFGKTNQPSNQIQVAKSVSAPQVKRSWNSVIQFLQQVIQGAALALFVRRFGAFATAVAVA